jgi:pimeloyl-ACP methyl ester carboxylesterase
MTSVRTSEFTHDGFRLVYDEYGAGGRPLVLLPGLLLPRTMHTPLARSLAEQGNHVFVLDPLGHGDSDRPRDMSCYSMTLFAEQVLGLMDHAGIDEAVVAGTSLGANITLETCVAAPERVRGAVIEMPVLDNALLGCALAFTPMLVAMTLGERPVRLFSRIAAALPRTPWHLANVGLDWVSLDPAPSGAYLQGLFFGRIAPPRKLRKLIQTPALVLGHTRDPVHPFSDAGALVNELPNARMVKASSILEMRLTPERLTGEIVEFVEGCWRGRARPGSSARRRPAGAAAAR